MKNSSWSVIKAESWHFVKDGNRVIKTKELQSIQERVNTNFGEFKTNKWLKLRNASKENRKGAQ